jgi:hypothetical protein
MLEKQAPLANCVSESMTELMASAESSNQWIYSSRSAIFEESFQCPRTTLVIWRDILANRVYVELMLEKQAPLANCVSESMTELMASAACVIGCLGHVHMQCTIAFQGENIESITETMMKVYLAFLKRNILSVILSMFSPWKAIVHCMWTDLNILS